jgi:hypothetical protein
VSETPTLQSIAPYRQALVAYAYDIVNVVAGDPTGPKIIVLHWAIRDGKTLPLTRRKGEVVRLAVEAYDDHKDLEGERVIMDMNDSGVPMFYEPP